MRYLTGNWKLSITLLVFLRKSWVLVPPPLEAEALCWGVNNLIAPRCLRRLVGSMAEVLSDATMVLTQPSVTQRKGWPITGLHLPCYDPLAPIRAGWEICRASPPPSPQPHLVVFTCERPNREPRWFGVPISVWQLTAERVASICSHTLEFSSSQTSWKMKSVRGYLQERKKYHHIKGTVHLKMRIHLSSIMPTESWVKFCFIPHC